MDDAESELINALVAYFRLNNLELDGSWASPSARARPRKLLQQLEEYIRRRASEVEEMASGRLLAQR